MGEHINLFYASRIHWVDLQFHPPEYDILDQNVHLRLGVTISESVPISPVAAMCRPGTSQTFRKPVGCVDFMGSWYFRETWSLQKIVDGKKGRPLSAAEAPLCIGTSLSW